MITHTPLIVKSILCPLVVSEKGFCSTTDPTVSFCLQSAKNSWSLLSHSRHSAAVFLPLYTNILQEHCKKSLYRLITNCACIYRALSKNICHSEEVCEWGSNTSTLVAHSWWWHTDQVNVISLHWWKIIRSHDYKGTYH